MCMRYSVICDTEEGRKKKVEREEGGWPFVLRKYTNFLVCRLFVSHISVDHRQFLRRIT